MIIQKIIHICAIVISLSSAMVLAIVPGATENLEIDQNSALSSAIKPQEDILDLAAQTDRVESDSSMLELTAWAPVVGAIGGAIVGANIYKSSEGIDQVFPLLAMISGGVLGGSAGVAVAHYGKELSDTELKKCNNAPQKTKTLRNAQLNSALLESTLWAPIIGGLAFSYCAQQLTLNLALQDIDKTALNFGAATVGIITGLLVSATAYKLSEHNVLISADNRKKNLDFLLAYAYRR